MGELADYLAGLPRETVANMAEGLVDYALREAVRADIEARAIADVLNALWDFGKRICSPVVCHFATTYGSKP